MPCLVDGREAGAVCSAISRSSVSGIVPEVQEELAQAPALDVLHDHVVDGLALQLGRVHVEGADHVLVDDLPPQLRLPQEPLEEAGRAQQVGMDDLDGDLLARLEARHGLGDLGGMNRPHASRATKLRSLHVLPFLAWLGFYRDGP